MFGEVVIFNTLTNLAYTEIYDDDTRFLVHKNQSSQMAVNRVVAYVFDTRKRLIQFTKGEKKLKVLHSF